MNKTEFLEARFNRAKANDESRTVPAVISTDNPVQRNGYQEILVHNTDSIDKTRFPLPLIESHNQQDINIGVVENPTISGGKLRATVRFGSTERAKELYTDVKNGIVNGLSVGYQIKKYTESTMNGDTVLMATLWQPLETSIVAIPADQHAGFFRELDMSQTSENQTNENQTNEKGINTKDYKRGSDDEKGRVNRIFMAAKTQGIDHDMAMEFVDKGISSSVAFDEFSRIKYEREKAREITAPTRTHDKPVDIYQENDRDPFMRRDIFNPQGQTRSIQENADGVHAAIVDGILMRSGIKVDKPHPAAHDFSHMSIHEISKMLLKERGHFGFDQSPAGLIKRAMSSSDLPFLLENAVNKSLLIGFDQAQQTHDKFVNFVEVVDFKTQSRIAMSFFESLEKVHELAEVTYSNISDSRETYAISSYQKGIKFSRQMLINDDLAELTNIPLKLGAAARRTEADLVYNILNNNPKMADGTELFHGTRGNSLTGSTASALSELGLSNAVIVLRKAKDIGNRGYLGLRPRWLIVPPELEMTAIKLLAALNNTKANMSAIPNTDFAQIEVIVEPRLTSPASWFLLAQGIETIEVGRLTNNGISYESDQEFNTDAFFMKVRLDAGAKALSPLGMIKSLGA